MLGVFFLNLCVLVCAEDGMLGVFFFNFCVLACEEDGMLGVFFCNLCVLAPNHTFLGWVGCRNRPSRGRGTTPLRLYIFWPPGFILLFFCHCWGDWFHTFYVYGKVQTVRKRSVHNLTPPRSYIFESVWPAHQYHTFFAVTKRDENQTRAFPTTMLSMRHSLAGQRASTRSAWSTWSSSWSHMKQVSSRHCRVKVNRSPECLPGAVFVP